MDFSQYRKLDGINWTSLKRIAESPMHYRYALSAPPARKAAYSIGSAVHCAILEPEKFGTKYAIKSANIDLRTRDGRTWRDEHRHMEIIDETTMDIIGAVKGHAQAMDVIDGLETEYTIQWTGHAGVACKGRLDAVGSGRIVDIKTTSRPLDRFSVEAAQYLYHGQMAYYLDGAIAANVLPKPTMAYIVAVETRPPYDVACYLLSAAEIQAGRVLYRSCIDQLLACTAADMWPGRYPAVAPLSLPTWAEGMGRDGEPVDDEEVW